MIVYTISNLLSFINLIQSLVQFTGASTPTPAPLPSPYYNITQANVLQLGKENGAFASYTPSTANDNGSAK